MNRVWIRKNRKISGFRSLLLKSNSSVEPVFGILFDFSPSIIGWTTGRLEWVTYLGVCCVLRRRHEGDFLASSAGFCDTRPSKYISIKLYILPKSNRTPPWCLCDLTVRHFITPNVPDYLIGKCNYIKIAYGHYIQYQSLHSKLYTIRSCIFFFCIWSGFNFITVHQVGTLNN